MLSSLIRRKRERSEMTFLEHVEDLRVSVIRVLMVFAVGMVTALIYYEYIPTLLSLPLNWAKNPETSPLHFILGGADESLKSMGELKEFTFMGVWSVLMYAAFSAGVAVASPVFLYETARFVGPALTTKEKKALIPFCVAAFFLFLAGAALAFFWLTPISIQVWHHFASGMGMEVIWKASDYFGLVTMMSLITGITFQFPLALIILMWTEIVRPKTLLKHWRGMLFGIVIVVGVLTPIGDIISLAILTSILFGFYLFAIGIGSVLVRRKRVARGDTPNPEEDEPINLDDEDDDEEDSEKNVKKPASKPKSSPPSTDGDISSLD
ncbi:MAG: twin-arginine translocase subunit TatC [Opitutales bacterium]|nr:twin-arginine translocase subunit TatC [Opitutales bacterium]